MYLVSSTSVVDNTRQFEAEVQLATFNNFDITRLE